MIEVLAQPMTRSAANEWLASRVNVTTDMTSRELALSPDFDARVRAHAFFSAQVAKADALEAVRAELEAYAGGEIDLATARWRAKTALTRIGYAADDVGMADEPPTGMSVDEWKARKAITNLASTRRLNLILQQNARMGWAVGRRQVSEDPAVKKRWPYWRYIARDDSRVRPDHAALDGMILAKDDPFWHSRTPPWDFNCRCDFEDADEEEAAEAGKGQAVTEENPDGSQTAKIVNPATGAAREILPPESGFVFRADEAFGRFDMARVRNLDMRRAVHGAVLREAQRTGAGLTLNGAPVPGQAAVRAPNNLGDIRTAFAQVHEAVQAGRDLPELRVSLGKVLREHAGSLGIDPAETSIWFNSPGQGRKQGAAHWLRNHPDTLNPDGAVDLLERTIWNSEATVRERIKGRASRRLVFSEKDGGAVTTLRRRGQGWELDIEDSWEPSEEYVTRANPRKRK